jgi:hypothetical protein
LEAGRDLLPSRVKFKEEALAVVHLGRREGGREGGRGGGS